MKNILLFLWFLATPVMAVDYSLDIFDDFCAMTRFMTNITSTKDLPDTVLFRLGSQAIKWTSEDIGGFEMQKRIMLAPDVFKYALPADTVSIINDACVYSMLGEFKSLRAVPRELYEDIFDVTDYPDIVGSEPGSAPLAYAYWADTLQVMPTPNRVDSLYIFFWARHPDIDTSSAKQTIRLKNNYAQAALFYCCYLTYLSLERYEDAAFYMAAYEKCKASLRELQASRYRTLAVETKQ